nr:MAG TPA: hypothetical protein [Caudoviricetes sp.]
MLHYAVHDTDCEFIRLNYLYYKSRSLKCSGI